MKKKLLSFFALCAFGGLLILKPSLVGMIEYLKKTNRPVLQKHEEHAQEVARDAHIAELRKQLGEAKTEEAKKEILRQLVDLDSAVQRLVPAKECKLSKEFTDFLLDAHDAHKVELLHEGVVYLVEFSSDGSTLTTKSTDCRTRIWDVKSGTLLRKLPCYSSFRPSEFSPDRSKMFTVSLDDEIVHVFDLKAGTGMYGFFHNSLINSVAFSPDSNKLFVESHDAKKAAQIWDITTGGLLCELPYDGWVLSVAFSPDSSKLVTNYWLSDTARIWDITRGTLLYEFLNKGLITSIAFSPDGNQLAIGSDDKKVQIWDVKIFERLQKLLVSPSRAQCDLLQAFSMLYSREKLGKKPAPIQATRAQWYTFQTFPVGVQKTLQKYIVAPEKEKDFCDPDKEKGKEKE